MRKNRERRLNLDWVSVSYRSLFLTLVVGAGLIVGGWLVWTHFRERASPRSLALREIEAAEDLYREAVTYAGEPRFASIQSQAREHLADARGLFASRRFEEARIKAILSRNHSQQILDTARAAESTRTEARFYRIDGEVKVRRSGNLLWEDANINESLRIGDAIRTSSRGSAQVIYFDGSITTVKPGSLVEISSLTTDPETRQVKVTENLRSGGVHAAAFGSNVAGSFHEVATKNSVARAETAKRAEFEVDYSEGATRLSVHEGEARLSSGEKSVVLKALERVRIAESGTFGPRERVLGAPRPISPSDQKIFVMENPASEPVRLAWSEVPGASGYRLQVSRHSLMADLAAEVPRQPGNSAELKELSAGNWYWRVAALGTGAEAGRFSPVWEFRILPSGASLTGDREPPRLDVTEFLQTGNLVIVSGRTEPDVNLWVANQKVDIYEDGTFTAVVRLHREGRNTLEIIAQDPAGNETVARREAFLEVF